MRSRFTAVVLSLVPRLLTAQDAVAPASPILTNHGEPMRAPFACAEDELQAAGLLCTEEEPCAIYLELNAIAPAGKKLFIAGDLHATSGTLSSILLASDDAGATWREAGPRVRGAALDQLQFYDLEHGWAAGETQYPLSRDPFFLVSTDGGASWRQRPVTEEGGPGSVQRFWFDSAQHGELVVDAGRTAAGGRYATYESETGGESWMARSATDQPPKIKRAPPSLENSDFRVRPSANGKTYLIQKRAGEKWETAASFLIETASCRVKPPEVKEPEPAAPAVPSTTPVPKD
ncbi:MAG: hypothetical protein M3N54_16405 [Acidobacteriota bacterium]|nr:hypothetical protein [Acidobacteriota bacterium]